MRSANAAHEHLKMELRLRGTLMSAVAQSIGVGPGSVTAVSQGRRRSQRIEKALATALDTTPAKLFPDRYKEGDDQNQKP